MTYPAGLVSWSGNNSGGVRRLFDRESGRPASEVIRTNLLARLENWAEALGEKDSQAPRILLLVGGPGNGKTEAIEATIEWLDSAMGCHGTAVSDLASSFSPPPGQPVPRLVRTSAGPKSVSVVQDATVVAGHPGSTAAQLLIAELTGALSAGASEIYLCCVNRGILDDALIAALEERNEGASHLLETITRAVSHDPDAPSCWPLDGFPDVAIWPMDAESLIVQTSDGGTAPVASILAAALDEREWLEAGACAARTHCPFCRNREVLVREEASSALLRILRWHELSSGKRWSFRDLFSLASYLLAGHRKAGADEADPCAWAASQWELHQVAAIGGTVSQATAEAIYLLVGSQYEHALFKRWRNDGVTALLRDIKDLGLTGNHTAMGLYHHLRSQQSAQLPAMIAPLLEALVDRLDPALASPDASVALSARTTVKFRDIDTRFSRSVADGIEYLKRHHSLGLLEVELLERLAALDELLSESGVRRSRPAAATRLQHLVRDFASRVTRRSLGARGAIVPEASVLTEYRSVIEDLAHDGFALDDVARQVEELLNHGEHFEIPLTTTFGQPLPPEGRRATLVVPRRPVSPQDMHREGRPVPPLCYLKVGSGTSARPIPLTYDLFKAVKELEEGMSPASLPRTVLALLDTTRARMSGPLVRDPGVLDRAKMYIGSSGVAIQRYRAGFVARRN